MWGLRGGFCCIYGHLTICLCRERVGQSPTLQVTGDRGLQTTEDRRIRQPRVQQSCTPYELEFIALGPPAYVQEPGTMSCRRPKVLNSKRLRQKDENGTRSTVKVNRRCVFRFLGWRRDGTKDRRQRFGRAALVLGRTRCSIRPLRR